jgi:hypothetical protein
MVTQGTLGQTLLARSWLALSRELEFMRLLEPENRGPGPGRRLPALLDNILLQFGSNELFGTSGVLGTSPELGRREVEGMRGVEGIRGVPDKIVLF